MSAKCFDWTNEAIAMLRQCIADRMTAKDAAVAIGERFDWPVTRNSVISKASYLSLKFDSRSGHNNKESRRSKHKDRPRVERKPRSRIAPLIPKPIEPVLAPVVEPASVIIPISGRVTLFELTNSTCRWPIGHDGEQHLFCGAGGADIAAGRPYCAHHAVKASSRQQAPQSAEANEKRRLAAMRRTPSIGRAA